MGQEEAQVELPPAPGGTALGDELLQRHRPYLLWDSQDDYRAIAATSILDNPGNLMMRGSRVLAGANGEGGRHLSLGLLAGEDGFESAKNDCLAEAAAPLHSSRRLQRDEGYANRVYGRCEIGADGVWLQYWLWLYYNPKSLLGFGRHEGDWEMVQLKLDPDTHEPLAVTYAQHGRGECKQAGSLEEVDWRFCEEGCSGGCRHPAVYVAPFSHASYFESGTHFHFPVTDNPDGAFFDGMPTVERLGSWCEWPGRWGASNRLLSVSPTSPGQQGKQWDQRLFQRRAKRRKPREGRLLWKLGRRTYPETPAIESASLDGDTVLVRWRLSPAHWWRRGRWVLLTVHTREEPARLLAKRLVRGGRATGETRIPVGERPLPEMAVRTSAFNRIRQRSDTSEAQEVLAVPSPETGTPRARDDWSPRVWARLCQQMLNSLVKNGAATIEDLERRRIEMLDLPLDRTELFGVLDHARRTNLIEPLGQARRADGSPIQSIEWAASESGRQKVRGPLRWSLKGLTATIPSGLLIAGVTYLLSNPPEWDSATAVLIAAFGVVALQVVVVATHFAYRYASGAGPRKIAEQWSRHAVELPALNRLYRSRLNTILIPAGLGGLLLASLVLLDRPIPIGLSMAGYAVIMLCQLVQAQRVKSLRRLQTEAKAQTLAEQDPPP